jgi:ABC-type multidrug transport system ATPase subunit
MHLSQRLRHKSIKALPDIDLPALTVLTGVNGAGKTHLLEAIKEGSVRCDAAPNPRTDVEYYDWNKLVPPDAGLVNVQNVYAPRDDIINQVFARKQERSAHLANELVQAGLQNYGDDPWALTSLGDQALADRLGPNDRPAGRAVIAREANWLKSAVRGNLGQDTQRLDYFDRYVGIRGEIGSISQAFFDDDPFRWRVGNLFQHQLGEMFLAYFDKERANKYLRLAEMEGATSSVHSLDDASFIKKHGIAPWDFLNETLEGARLDFRIDHPSSPTTTQYKPTLTKILTGDSMEFSALSSGERVLMSFALCLYNSTDHRQVTTRPKLLLFDEIDAPLHPSMARTLMTTIKDVLVDRQKVNVILATHSPSTVAVAPDDAIHLIEPGTNQISAEKKRQAIAILTSEIPTLAIAVDGRRQVFVESQFDAERYQRLYQKLSARIQSERSITFIGVGSKRDKQDRGTGCAQVAKIVGDLESGGNISVLGLIDWDGKHTSTPRLRVLASGERYAVENCLLDPLLVAAAVIRESGEAASSMFGPWASGGTRELSKRDPNELQRVVDEVQRLVLGRNRTHDDKQYAYLSGTKLRLDAGYLEMNGHLLEQKVKTAFPRLMRLHNDGQLMLHMIDPILGEYPEFCPVVLFDAIKDLCEVSL